ncbi:MAG: Zn-ribbon domain-containing OB-fold protein [Halobacteriaceae archaeon]
MTEDTARDAGYDDFLDAVAADAGYYLACPNDHGWLPPRRVCPTCGATDFTERSLPDTGTVTAASTVHVAAPQFVDDVPYAVALAEFGPVELTGQVRGMDPDAVDPGLSVTAVVVESETTGDRLLGFEPV